MLFCDNQLGDRVRKTHLVACPSRILRLPLFAGAKKTSRRTSPELPTPHAHAGFLRAAPGNPLRSPSGSIFNRPPGLTVRFPGSSVPVLCFHRSDSTTACPVIAYQRGKGWACHQACGAVRTVRSIRRTRACGRSQRRAECQFHLWYATFVAPGKPPHAGLHLDTHLPAIEGP